MTSCSTPTSSSEPWVTPKPMSEVSSMLGMAQTRAGNWLCWHAPTMTLARRNQAVK